jgi:hypothetical protein
MDFPYLPNRDIVTLKKRGQLALAERGRFNVIDPETWDHDSLIWSVPRRLLTSPKAEPD